MSASPEPAVAAPPPRAVYAALLLTTLATLLLQLGLTRLFSVLMYYHMAFFAVSVTLFGIALGGVIVHFLPRLFTVEATPAWMRRMALAAAAATAAALVVLLAIPFNLASNTRLIGQMMLVSLVLAVPFTCTGVAVALALTRYPRRTNLLYGFDLIGAAAGCLLFPPLITWLGGPRFVLAVALLLAAAGLVLAASGAPRRRTGPALTVAVGLALILLLLLAAAPRLDFLKLRHVRGQGIHPDDLEYEGWNTISRITAYSEAPPPGEPSSQPPQKTILIDTYAATPIIPFDGEHFTSVQFAFHDISYPVHALLDHARVAVIGTGGGRDVLAAKAWGQPEVVGIEINSRTLEALTEVFAEFAGHPLRWPGVTLVLDEARSVIARSPRPFDIIQASLIDTFAATAAGAFVLTENSLYTLEGWHTFLDKLTPRGILTMSRWYTAPADAGGNACPVETIRLLTLARATLEQRGAARPRDHIMMARSPRPDAPGHMSLATILVAKEPFSSEQVTTFEQWVRNNGMIEMVTPNRIADPLLAPVLEAPDLAAFAADYPFDISPPTDDKPFFFDVLRWRDIFRREFRQGSDYIYAINLKPIIMLGTLLATVVAMAFAFIVVPLGIEGRLRQRRMPAHLAPGRRLSLVAYFVMLGLGYLMIELSLMQRFTVFLGHPAYSLTVCLFTMLLASGLGSMAAPRVFRAESWPNAARSIRLLNLVLFGVLLATLAGSLWMMQRFVASPTPVRILLAGAAAAPAAFLMGMPFPLAIQAAARRPNAPLSWYWGINGAFSVCSSVLVVALAHTIGLSATFVVGAGCYLAAAAVAWAFGPTPAEQAPPPLNI
ncbi:MAG TPA: class I SAM-dependent methyltransferase [Candidatus Sumerlaeota bacterium]|nr:class I SAM-dependent methyltransferase [Candidatus Sumerlaeota bacterium]